MTETTERAATEGLVSARIPSLLDEPLRTLGRGEPLIVAPGTSLAECLRAIRRQGVGDSVVVADRHGRLLGVLTERDIFTTLIGTMVDLRQPVDAFMNTGPHTLRLEHTVRDAMRLMDTGRYRNIPIVDDDGAIAGIVRQQDLLRALAESFPEELLNLPPRPHQQLEETDGG
jgi:CBS domain-containing protein